MTDSERIPHTCCVCGYVWTSIDLKTENDVIKAVKVNKTGPYCLMCMHLEMAERYAIKRGIGSLVEAFAVFKKQ